jgi:hypothetical protein
MKRGRIMKYVNQLDYPHLQYVNQTSYEDPAARERGRKDTIATAGCGLCCSIMVADRLRVLNGDYEVEDARQLSYDVGANRWSGTRGNVFFPAFAEKLNLDFQFSHDIEDVLQCVRTGGAAIALVAGDRDGQVGLFTHIGHYIVVINEEPDGRLAILDPNFYDKKFEESGREGKVEITYGNLALCSKDVLAEEAKAHTGIPYYIFRRK